MPILLILALAQTMFGSFTTFIGDSSYAVTQMVSDSAGNTYLCGGRQSGAMTGATQYDVFVTKVDPRGKVLFTRTFGGRGSEMANAIAVSLTGEIYVGGRTTSEDFPLSNALQSVCSAPNFGCDTGFLLKLSPDGRALLQATYYGGLQGASSVNALTVDSKGNLYATGSTSSYDFPDSLQISPAGAGGVLTAAFIAEISASGDKVIFSGLLSGVAAVCTRSPSMCASAARTTTGIAIAVDAAGTVYVAGNTNATDLPGTAGAFLVRGVGPFVAKLKASGTGLIYLTYLDSFGISVRHALTDRASLLAHQAHVCRLFLDRSLATRIIRSAHVGT